MTAEITARRKKVLLLLNASSGTGAARNQAYDIIENLAVRNCEVTVFPILPKKGMAAEDIIRRYGHDFDVIMCCGGDGTLNHVVQGMMDCGLNRIPVGYLPGGSTNDFARSAGLPLSVEKICAAVAGERFFAYDIGRFQERYFNYVAAFGAFTNVSYSTDQTVKNLLGHAAYILQGITTLPETISTRYRLRIQYEKGEGGAAAGAGKQTVMEGSYLFGAVCNGSTVGGLTSPLIQDSSLNDGVFEVLLISVPENIGDVGDIIASLASGSTDNRYVHLFRTTHLEIRSAGPVSWTLDGEFGGSHKSAVIENCRRAIRLLIP